MAHCLAEQQGVLLGPAQRQAVEVLEEATGQMNWLMSVDDGADDQWREIAQSKQALVPLGRSPERLRQPVEGEVGFGHRQGSCAMGILEQDDELRVGLWLIGDDKVRVCLHHNVRHPAGI